MTYLTIDEFKAERNIVNDGDDPVISSAISEAKAAIDAYCHRTFEGSVSDRTFDSVSDVEGGVLWVYEVGDLASIASITNGDGTTIANSAYVTEPRNAVAMGVPIRGIRLKTNSTVFWQTSTNGATEDAITVNGVWAYSQYVPGDISRAAKIMANFYYDYRLNSSGDTVIIPGVSVKIPSGMPSAVKQLLSPYIKDFF